jgi:hypothetical protein
MSRSSQRRFRRHRDYSSRKKGESRLFCPLCNKPLGLVSTSIIHQETNRRAHFDCIIKELKKSYHLNPNEEMYYLGGGCFGIVERDKGKSPLGFIIKKKFQYEKRE